MINQCKLPVLVTGAAGFIGTCLCNRLLDHGIPVVALDSLARRGSELNSMELASRGLSVLRIDVTDLHSLADLFSQRGPFSAVFHLAAQVAVTTSYQNRRHDFNVNAVGSFNVIECVKRYCPDAYCLYASTNKVYGHIEVSTPIDSSMPLNPYTPYGVSKAVGDLYFSEYGRPEIGLTTCSLRQSCIYGHHQYGVEDQGWIAWFTIANLLNRGVTIYGDGKQVRDLLFVDDLIDLYLECFSRRLTGSFPVGGGVSNQISLRPALACISAKTGKEFVTVQQGEERPGDQPYFVADNSWASGRGIGWVPKIGIDEGLHRMTRWLTDNIKTIESVLG